MNDFGPSSFGECVRRMEKKELDHAKNNTTTAYPQFAGRARAVFAAVCHKISKGNALGFDKALLKLGTRSQTSIGACCCCCCCTHIGVNHAAALRRRPTVAKEPRARLLRADREEAACGRAW